MTVQKRIALLVQLGDYIQSNNQEWQEVKLLASQKNGWFIPAFLDIASQNIVEQMLQKEILENFVARYNIPNENDLQKTVGIVMAGNIPLVGFHDFLCGFISGHKLKIKLSEKDDVLLKHLTNKMIEWDITLQEVVVYSDLLKNCDAYIATGSNNSARYFEQYFGKYPNIIRKNRTSVAILTGTENETELLALAEDVHYYFGLGCRNVTQLYVPHNYDFFPLLKAFKNYSYFSDHNKYRNNYDYNLALAMLNKVYYMTNETTLLIQNDAIFSPISQLHYSFYTNENEILESLKTNESVQCIVSKNHIPFGAAQQPAIDQFADGVDTMEFLVGLK
jgi:Acyl-CoA reductase (LuxC)